MRRRDESRKIKAITCNKKRDGESELKGGGAYNKRDKQLKTRKLVNKSQEKENKGMKGCSNGRC